MLGRGWLSPTCHTRASAVHHPPVVRNRTPFKESLACDQSNHLAVAHCAWPFSSHVTLRPASTHACSLGARDRGWRTGEQSQARTLPRCYRIALLSQSNALYIPHVTGHNEHSVRSALDSHTPRQQTARPNKRETAGPSLPQQDTQARACYIYL